MSILQLGRNEFGNPANAGNTLTREEAGMLFTDWVKNERLQLQIGRASCRERV